MSEDNCDTINNIFNISFAKRCAELKELSPKDQDVVFSVTNSLRRKDLVVEVYREQCKKMRGE